MADTGELDDTNAKRILTIGEQEQARLQLHFQRLQTSGGGLGADAYEFSLSTFWGTTKVCESEIVINQNHDEESVQKISFQYYFWHDDSALIFNVDGQHHEVYDCAHVTLPDGITLQPIPWKFGGAQTDNSAPTFAMDDLRIWRGADDALTANNWQQFFGGWTDPESLPDAYFDFNASANPDAETCAIRFNYATDTDLFGNAHYVTYDSWLAP
jgi:hypothetical protein